MTDLSNGSVFAGYRLVEVAGQGGMGRVYRATQVALNRPVALKLIVPELADDPDFRARFKRESLLAASIDHPNVIPVYEAGEAEGHLFISMRWVDGTDLRSLILSEGRLAPERAVSIVQQVAGALDAAHRRGLVHRDVKPANVLVTRNGDEHAYLTDFGLTKRAASTTALTATGHFVGTPDYTPPEQIKGEHADARADVYALGCLLYHALTGHTPYPRDSEVAKMYAHLHEPPPSVVEAVPSTPSELDDVISRAMAKEPDDRYPSAGDLGHAARAALSGVAPTQPERSLATGQAAPIPETAAAAPAEGSSGLAPTAPARTERIAPEGVVATTPAGPSAAPAEAAAPSPPPQAVPPPTDRPSRRRPLLLGAAGVLLLAVAAGVLALAGVFSGSSSHKGTSSSGGAQPKAVATIPAGKGPDGIDVQGNSVWVSDADENTLTRIDARTNKRIGDPITVGRNPDGVAAEPGVVWVANTDSGTVTRVETTKLGSSGPQATGTSNIKVGSEPEGISLGKQLVWVSNGGDDTQSRIDRASTTVLNPPIGVGNKPIGVFVGPTAVWVANSLTPSVSRLDASTSKEIGPPLPAGKNSREVIEALGSVWVSSTDENTVTRFNPKTGKQIGNPIDVGDRPKEMAPLAGSIWVVNEGSNSVTQIDAKEGRVLGVGIPVGSKPVGIAAGAGSLWVTNNLSDTITRIDPGS
jgi:serine/threonine protein kinase/DNA-binding beta-propeller fold protein YncE